MDEERREQVEGAEEVLRIRREFDERSVGPLWIGLADVPRGRVLSVGVKPDADLPGEGSGIESHRARWVFFKQSDKLDTEYTTFGLEVEWPDPEVGGPMQHSVVLLFPASEHLLFLGEVAVAREILLVPSVTMPETLEEQIRAAVFVTELPQDTLVEGMLALMAVKQERREQ